MARMLPGTRRSVKPGARCPGGPGTAKNSVEMAAGVWHDPSGERLGPSGSDCQHWRRTTWH